MKPFLLLILCFCLSAAFSQPERVKLYGKVTESDSLTALPNAHVLINGTRGVTTDWDGEFIVWVHPLDSIEISYLGRAHFQYIIPGSAAKSLSITIALTKDTVNLKEVDIYPWPSKENFKEAFMDLNLPEEEQVELNLPKLEDMPPVNYSSGGGGGAVIPLSSMFKYKGFYKIKNEQAAIDRWVGKEQHHSELVKRFKTIAQQVTDIKEEEINEFMKFCNLSDEKIEEKNDYDLAVAIVNCYEQFKN